MKHSGNSKKQRNNTENEQEEPGSLIKKHFNIIKELIL